MGTYEGRGDGLHRLSEDDDDIFGRDKKLIEAWHEILKRFFQPAPSNDNKKTEPDSKV
ncbi:MAG: hypothetical protein AAB923_03815 [Patescibacteria group bacterium]